MFVCRSRAKHPGGGYDWMNKCLRVNGLPWVRLRNSLTGGEGLANRGRSVIGIGESIAREFGMGAQALGRAREALCPYGLFVSPAVAVERF